MAERATRKRDEEIETLLDAEDYDEALTSILVEYGGEVYGYLLRRLGRRDAADDVYQQVSYRMLLTLPEYRRETCVRAWVYMKVRQEMKAFLQGNRRYHAECMSAAELSRMTALIERVRTRTAMRTETRMIVRSLADELDPLDQDLIIFRVDKQLSWKDITHLINESSDEQYKEGTLRQRYRRAKERLRELAREANLGSGDDDILDVFEVESEPR
jgi:RNA polymerase sigma factor (sigma-70 family)